MKSWRDVLRHAVDRRRHPEVEFGFQLPPANPGSGSHPDIPQSLPYVGNPPRIAVALHVFYPELVPGLLREVTHLEEPFDLLVTNSSGAALSIEPTQLPWMHRHVVWPVRNLGRDVFPFVQLLSSGQLSPYELVLKIHTKRSAWRDEYIEKARRRAGSAGLQGGGDAWRDALVTGLLGDASHVRAISRRFNDHPKLGLLTAPQNLLGPAFWGYNVDLAGQLCRRAGIPFRPEELLFPAGSMYWCRVSSAELLLSLRLSCRDFPAERGQTDGTTAHAVERVLGLLLLHRQMRLTEAPAVPGP